MRHLIALHSWRQLCATCDAVADFLLGERLQITVVNGHGHLRRHHVELIARHLQVFVFLRSGRAFTRGQSLHPERVDRGVRFRSVSRLSHVQALDGRVTDAPESLLAPLADGASASLRSGLLVPVFGFTRTRNQLV